MKRLSRNVALTAGLLAVLLLGASAVFWKDLVAHYHLHRLRSEPGYFGEILEHPPGTPERIAVLRFLKSAPGKEMLFREYSNVVLKSVLQGDYAETALEALAWGGETRGSYIHWAPPKSTAEYGVEMRAPDLERWTAVRSLLGSLEDEEFVVDEYPHLQFTILNRTLATESVPMKRVSSNILPDQEQVCLIRRQPESAIPMLIQLLSDYNSTFRIQAAASLAAYGAEASSAIPSLEAALQENNRFEVIRQALSDAIETIQPLE